FFQKEDIRLPLQTNPHRKLFGIDFVGFNLETPIVQDDKNCIISHKEVQFCSDAAILPYLSQLGFNIANVANNHSFDGGTQAHEETIQLLKENNIHPIGYERNSTYFEKNYEWKTTIRGIPIAREGFDLTITPRRLFSGYCELLKKNKAEGRISLVSVHRGTEYQTTHDTSQESIAKQLIQCGADIIIGHHPHVIQDIGRYQGKPIIYSLGNFLFDMKDPPATKIGGYVLIDYRIDGEITLLTGTINASIYK
ncbi:MAG: CapA family protein, partial [Candidatus Absconditabacterales bacterium]